MYVKTQDLTYIEEWYKLMENFPFIVFQEKLLELFLARPIVLGKLNDHVSGTLQFKRTSYCFCERIPAGGNRADEHSGLNWGF